VSFELPTLTLGTVYDAPQAPLAVGGAVEEGDHPSVVLLDGANRARGRVLRANRPHPLVGVRMEPATGAVRVVVAVSLDRDSRERWAAAGAPPPRAHHRLLTVTAQGRPSGAVLLVPDPVDGTARQRLDLVLQPDEVGELLVVGLEDASPPSGWGSPLSSGAVGVLLARMAVEPLAAPCASRVSTGRARAARARPETVVDPGYLVVNPGSSGAGTELRLRPTDNVPRPLRMQVAGPDGVLILDDEAVPTAQGEVVVPVTSLTGPVFVRALDVATGTVTRAFGVGVRG
jgi:hypothetical protein